MTGEESLVVGWRSRKESKMRKFFAALMAIAGSMVVAGKSLSR